MIYQVSFRRIYPRSGSSVEDDDLTAFVEADSFDEAKKRVEEKYKKEWESAEIFGICIPTNVTIII